MKMTCKKKDLKTTDITHQNSKAVESPLHMWPRSSDCKLICPVLLGMYQSSTISYSLAQIISRKLLPNTCFIPEAAAVE